MPLECHIQSKQPELILLIYGHGSISDIDIENFYNFFLQHLKGNEPFKVLYDLNHINAAPIKILKTLQY